MKQNEHQAEKADQDYPGYPHYPAGEDITNPANGNRKVPIDADKSAQETDKEQKASDITAEEANDLTNTSENRDYVQGESTERGGIDQTDEDGDLLNEATETENGPGADLDVPGNEDDASGEEGLADEENNYYSLGGDNHESLEEDTQ